MQLKHSNSPPKKGKSDLYAGKAMASICWGAEGILFIDYHQ